MSKSLCFFNVEPEYIKFLKKTETAIYGKTCVPSVNYAMSNKFMCGVLFSFGSLKYIAPISSKTEKIRNNIQIKNRNDEVTSTIRLNYMFPVVEGCYTYYDFKKEPDIKYRDLVQQEYNYINRPHIKKEILRTAKKVYFSAKQFVKETNQITWCSDLKLLERAATRWSELTVQASQFWAVEPTATGNKLHDGFTILSNPENQWFLLKDGLPKANGEELSIGDKTTIDESVEQYSEDARKDMLSRFDSKQTALDYWETQSAAYRELRDKFPQENEHTRKTQDIIDELLPAEFKPKASGSGSSSGKDERGK